jgi:hypothetical protein
MLVPLDELLKIRRPNGSYLKDTVGGVPGCAICVSRFSKSQVKLVGLLPTTLVRRFPLLS